MATMLPLVLALLGSAALGRPSPLPPNALGCSASPLIEETLEDIEGLAESTKKRTLDMTEPVDNVFAYLERFIQVLGKIHLPTERRVTKKLRKILAARDSCPGWTNPGWDLMLDKNLYQSLEYLLRFLKHNAYSSKKV